MKIVKSIPFLFVTSFFIMAGMLLLNFNKLPPQIPLFYSYPNASSQVVDVMYIALLPAISLIAVLINSFGLKRLFQGEELGQDIVYIANLIIIGGITYIFIRILLLVT